MGWGPEASAFWSTYYLAPTLSKAGYNPVYMALDDQRFMLPWYVNKMFTNEKTKTLFGGIAVHWYTDSLFSPIRLTEIHNKYPDKFILMTEACSGKHCASNEKNLMNNKKYNCNFFLAGITLIDINFISYR